MAATLIEMRRQLASMIQESRRVLDTARAENRALTEQENADYETREGQMVALRAQIRDEERRQALELEGGAPVPGGAPEARTMGDVLQQAAAREFATRGTRLRGVELRAASGQNETEGADGGYLLSPTVSTELLGGVQETSFFLPKARRLTVGMDSNSVDMPYLLNKNRKDSVYTSGSEAYNRFGGTTAYWMDEADAYTATQVKFATRSIKLAKLGAMGYATEEMLRDSRYLESIMRDAFMNAMTWEIDEAILTGAGTVSGQTVKPTGLLNGTASTGNAALITVAKETGQTAATVNLQNILKMYSRMHPATRAKAIWLVNPDVELQLIQMTMQTGSISSSGESAVENITGTFGMPVYMPPNGLASAPYGTLLGRPVVPNEHMATLGSLGDIAFIDPSEYFWIDRDGITQASSIHVRFAYDEMAFKFTYRCNGMPSWYAAETPAKGSTTRSPYVTLAARA